MDEYFIRFTEEELWTIVGGLHSLWADHDDDEAGELYRRLIKLLPDD